MKVTLDFETRSTVDLRSAGAWRYAEDPGTDVLCLAYSLGGAAPWVWFPRGVAARLPEGHSLPQNHDNSIKRMLERAGSFEAHNAEFERAIWYHIMHKRYGFPDLPLDKVFCTAARAATHALPRDLLRAGRALGLDTQKDIVGHRLMLKMCKPRKPRKAEIREILERGDDPDTIVLWHEGGEDLVNLAKYCIDDVITEVLLSKKLRALPSTERRVWIMDQKINQRGLPVDLDSIEAIIETVAAHERKLKKEFGKLSPYAPTQVGGLLSWLDLEGVELPNLQKQTVVEVLKTDIPANVRRVLEIRQSLGRSSVAKHVALQRMAGEDGRVRGTTMYHGAATGRWSGKGFQPQNLYRGDFPDVENAIQLMVDGDLDAIELLYGDPMSVASTLVRPMILASPGKDLISTDLAAIEARGTAWLAGEERVLEIFRGEGQIYEAAAVDVFGGDIADVTPQQRQIGKVVILACGYQGHVGAFQSMAKTYGVDIDDEHAGRIVNAWRSNNTQIVALWYALEEVAMNAIKDPKKVTEYSGIRFVVRNGFLIMRLPSGRFLYYCNPGTRFREHPTTGHVKEGITYWGVDSMTNQWKLTDTYGGKLAENAIQALCRDILAEAMLRVEEDTESPYEIIMHVHDEIVVEVPEGRGSVEEMVDNMSIVPSWALGLPITAEGWRGKRYRK